MTRFQAVHDQTGLTIELIELVGPSGGWPEVRFTGEHARIQALAEIVHPDYDDLDELIVRVQTGVWQLDAPFVYEESRPATPGWVLEQVVEWLDEVVG